MKFLSEILSGKKAVFTFGRMNPPHRGHEKVIENMLMVSRKENATPFIFLSQTQDIRKNPLSYQQKIKYLAMGISDYKKHIVANSQIKTIFDVIQYLYSIGYTNLLMVVGADRVSEFDTLIKKYINHPDKSKRLPIKNFAVISAGLRDPDAEGVEGFSASRVRDAVKRNDFASFYSMTLSGLSERFAREMFDELKKSMKIAESIIHKIKGLGFTRNEMPQIAERDISSFLDELKEQGILVSKKYIRLDKLKPTQSEINLQKVKQKYEHFKKHPDAKKPFVVSSDDYILDGHHQLFALRNIDEKQKVIAHVVSLNIRELLNLAKKSRYSTRKKIYETI
jgi:hypothetical protein